MSDTIDFGIDLGTTNSAIAVARGGEVSIIKKNFEPADYTPSAVWIRKAGVKSVGRPARNQSGTDPENVHTEFKQEMGLDGVRRTFPNAGISLTPQELSAEVLKSLRDDVAQQLGEPPPAAVITVPAAFRLHQNNATSEAAALAGFGACPLVQEPTAAAFAYGFQHESSDAYWMVFDFGGGTFDAAVVATHEGELRVIDHAGNPHLGGKLIDWAVVEKLLAPGAARELGLSDFTRSNPQWRANFARLKLAAEEAKVQLSQTPESVVLVDLVLPDRTSVTYERVLRRDEVDRIAEPYYLQAINLCRDALAKANLRPADIDRLLLVGGATLAPGLRERLADAQVGLGIELDHSQDPATVVARGAAVFASTVPLPRSKVRPSEGEFVVDLRYERVTSQRMEPVAGIFDSATDQDWTQYHVVLDNPDGAPPFRSDQVTLDEKGRFATEVPVDEQVTSTFAVLLFDATGRRMKVTPGSVRITRWHKEVGGPVLTNSIGVSEADQRFTPILRKGTRLPATARKLFTTTSDLRRMDSVGVVRIPIVEGERPRADRNLQVGLIEIRSKDVRIDLPKGSEVEITIEVDESRRVTVVADVPMVDEQFEAEIDLSHVQPPNAEKLADQVREAQLRLSQLRESVHESGSTRAQDRLDQLDQEQRLPMATDAARAAQTDESSAAAADEQLRDLQAELDDVEEQLQTSSDIVELESELRDLRSSVGRQANADDRAELAAIERRFDQLRDAPATAGIDELRTRIAELEISLMRREGSLDITIFYYFREHQHQLTSPAKARGLIAEGERAIASQDWRSLPAINQRLRALLPPDLPGPAGSGGVWSQDRGR